MSIAMSPLSLEELGCRHGTDKFEHGYLRHYASRFGYLRHVPITLLEIGTFRGESVRMWREFFDNPLTKIVGIDHKPEWLPGPDDGITVEVGRQENPDFQADFGRRHGPFDIVIDDGGHKAHQHLISLGALWPFVAPGGWYVIEDCHSLFNPCWTQPGEPTMLDWIRTNGQSVLVGGHDVIEVHIVGGNWCDGLIFLRKRTNELSEQYVPEPPPKTASESASAA
jgi:hypothetical protein